MRRESVVLLVLLVGTACDRQPDTIAPPPSPAGLGVLHDAGFPIKPRPECTADVIPAVGRSDIAAIQRLAAGGAAFTCGPAGDPLPLDNAVMKDDPALVLGLLEAHADPTARWSSHGDRFPLQEALEAQSYGRPSTHRDQILRILLTHGADPDQRWCPFESRGDDQSQHSCVSRYGVTPLIWASAADEPGTTFLLLQAGADPTLEDQFGANALDRAHGEAVFYQLMSAISAKRSIRGADVLRYVAERDVKDAVDGPWDETPLTRAISGDAGGIPLAPLPRPPAPIQGVQGFQPSRIPAARYASRRAGRVRALLALGADPNVRLTRSGVDWTALGLAVEQRDHEIVRALLRDGADPNARWCVPVERVTGSHVYQPEPACTRHSGITALMFASAIGDLTVLGALLERRDVDLALKDWNGRTAIEYAHRASHPDAVYQLRRAARLKTYAQMK
jgi:ankyrin repeat protein